jgi:predicted TIM-barrel fold metal-dependent hydrolase
MIIDSHHHLWQYDPVEYGRIGSDWPVGLIATEYGRWLSTTLALLGPLGTDERNRILGDNAAQFYGIM